MAESSRVHAPPRGYHPLFPQLSLQIVSNPVRCISTQASQLRRSSAVHCATACTVLLDLAPPEASDIYNTIIWLFFSLIVLLRNKHAGFADLSASPTCFPGANWLPSKLTSNAGRKNPLHSKLQIGYRPRRWTCCWGAIDPGVELLRSAT